MEDLVSMCERRCRKACNLRSAAEDSDEACHSGSSGGRTRRYRKRGSPESAARDVNYGMLLICWHMLRCCTSPYAGSRSHFGLAHEASQN